MAKEAKRKGREWLEKAAAEGLDEQQSSLSGASFERLVEEVLVLLDDDHLDAADDNIIKLVTALVGAGKAWLDRNIEQNAA